MTKPRPRNRDMRSNQGKMRRPAQDDPDQPIWLWGTHAVAAALTNPEREVIALHVTRNAARRLESDGVTLPAHEEASPKDLDHLLPPSAVHQGVALRTKRLEDHTLEAAITGGDQYVLVLDQVSDPQNIGALLRSAAAFGFQTVIAQTRHTPPFDGVVAKAAVGAVETLREVRVVNIARALEELSKRGYACIGLAGEGEMDIRTAVRASGPVALVMGAEGAGLRPVVAKACDRLAAIPMSEGMESLNVSNAAAIALYEVFRSASEGGNDLIGKTDAV